MSFKLARICPLAAVLFLAFPSFAPAATPPNSVAQASEAPARFRRAADGRNSDSL